MYVSCYYLSGKMALLSHSVCMYLGKYLCAKRSNTLVLLVRLAYYLLSWINWHYFAWLSTKADDLFFIFNFKRYVVSYFSLCWTKKSLKTRASSDIYPRGCKIFLGAARATKGFLWVHFQSDSTSCWLMIASDVSGYYLKLEFWVYLPRINLSIWLSTTLAKFFKFY